MVSGGPGLGSAARDAAGTRRPHSRSTRTVLPGRAIIGRLDTPNGAEVERPVFGNVEPPAARPAMVAARRSRLKGPADQRALPSNQRQDRTDQRGASAPDGPTSPRDSPLPIGYPSAHG